MNSLNQSYPRSSKTNSFGETFSSHSATANYTHYTAELKREGTILIPPNLVFGEEELVRLNAIQGLIQEEKVRTGDAGDTHDIYVRRIMTDKPGDLPSRVNQPFSDQIIDILEDKKRKRILAQIFDSNSEYFIRRCQINRMIEGSFIGLHLDVDSNPDYEFSVIVQLGQDFQGGEFIVYPDNRGKQVFSPKYGSFIVTTCRFHHEVKTVLANERTALVYFYSRHGGVNRRSVSND